MPLTTEAALRKDKTNAHGTGAMEHRHFAMIAGIIADMAPGVVRARVARQFADKLHYSNPRFDRQRFLLACGEPE